VRGRRFYGLVLFGGAAHDDIVGLAPSDGHHLRSEAGVRSQDAMVAVTVHARRGDESCEALEELEW
jgi:hypothetical protein